MLNGGGGFQKRKQLHAAHLHAVGLFNFRDVGVNGADVIGGIDFGRHDDVRLFRDDGVEICLPEGRGQGVDADDQLTVIVEGAHGVLGEDTGGVRLRQGHGILQVDDDAVGAVDIAVEQVAGLGAGHEEHGTSHSSAPPCARRTAASTLARMT